MNISTARKMDLSAALETITMLINHRKETPSPVAKTITEAQVETFENTLKRTFAVLSKAFKIQMQETKSLRRTAKKNREVANLIARYQRRFDRIATKAYTTAKFNRLAGRTEG
jgi:hypothetical protein